MLLKTGWKPNNHIAQGSALGKHYPPNLNSPCKGKSLIIKVLPLQGALFIIYTIMPRALPWAMRLLGFQPVFDHIISFTGQQ